MHSDFLLIFWFGTHFAPQLKSLCSKDLNLWSLHFGLLAIVEKQNTPTHSRGHREVLPAVLQCVRSVCSGRLVMSGLLGVRGLLLLWASACLCLPWLARGALVISGEREAPQVKSQSWILQVVYSGSLYDVTRGTDRQSCSWLPSFAFQDTSEDVRTVQVLENKRGKKHLDTFFYFVEFYLFLLESFIQTQKIWKFIFYLYLVIYLFFQKRSTNDPMVRKWYVFLSSQ